MKTYTLFTPNGDVIKEVYAADIEQACADLEANGYDVLDAWEDTNTIIGEER